MDAIGSHSSDCGEDYRVKRDEDVCHCLEIECSLLERGYKHVVSS